MKEIILIKDGELALKGLNRSSFESMLMKNIKRRIHTYGAFQLKSSQSTITVTPVDDNADLDAASDEISRVFGISAYSRAAVSEKDIDKILEIAPEYLKDQLEEARTFKVEAKRSDKSFPYTSPEISAMVGGKLLETFHHLKVDVKNPDIKVTVEIRDKAYIRGNQLKGAGGMPGRIYLILVIGVVSCAQLRHYHSCRYLCHRVLNVARQSQPFFLTRGHYFVAAHEITCHNAVERFTVH